MRRVTVTTEHGGTDRAKRIAAAVRPDNTAEMATRTDGDRIRTTIDRETTGSLQATVDDYVVNLTVAAKLAAADDGEGTATLTLGLTARDDAETDAAKTDDAAAADERTDRKTNEHADTNTDT